MSNSTFFRDGYRDASEGKAYSPPGFSVHCAEYQRGYNSFFDRRDAMWLKLRRCEAMARDQRRLTMQEAAECGAGWTAEDFAILMPRNLIGGTYECHRGYRTNLNA